MNIVDTIRASWKARRERELKRREDLEKAKEAELEVIRADLRKHAPTVAKELEDAGFKVLPTKFRSADQGVAHVVAPSGTPYRVLFNRGGLYEILAIK